MQIWNIKNTLPFFIHNRKFPVINITELCRRNLLLRVIFVCDPKHHSCNINSRIHSFQKFCIFRLAYDLHIFDNSAGSHFFIPEDSVLVIVSFILQAEIIIFSTKIPGRTVSQLHICFLTLDIINSVYRPVISVSTVPVNSLQICWQLNVTQISVFRRIFSHFIQSFTWLQYIGNSCKIILKGF